MKQKMNRILNVFLPLLFLFIILDDSIVFAEWAESPIALEIDDKIQAKEFYIDLDGDWNFFEKELLSPDEVIEKLKNGMGTVVSLPDSFESQTGDINSFGTYS